MATDNPNPAGDLLTPAELDAIRARADAATERPWRVSTADGYDPPNDWQGEVTGKSLIDGATLLLTGRMHHRPNAELMAHARTDIPALLAHIAEQERVNKQLREALERECVAKHGENHAWAKSMCPKCNIGAALDAAGRK